MVTTFYPPYSFGGDAIFVRALARGLASRGHQVDVIHCVDSYQALAASSPASKPGPESEPAGITVHALRSPFGILSPLLTQQTGRPWLKSSEIQRIFASQSFDVIHFHNVSLVGGAGVLRLGDAVKLYTLHEHWLLCPMHTLFRDNRELCIEKRCVSCSLRYGRPPQWWRYSDLLDRSVREVDAFLAPTEFTRQIHLAAGLPLRMIKVLGNFHEPSPAARASGEARQVPSRPFFLYAGRLEKIKGIHDLIKVFRVYEAADLVIAGDGAEAPALRAMAHGCERIHFLGKVDQNRLSDFLSRAVAVLIPSVGYEVFPLVALEAFAAGTPVIARNLGSLTEILEISKGGLLFDNHAGLKAALERLQTSPTLRTQLGNAGRDAWSSRWTRDVHLDRYLALVDQLREQRRSGL